MKHYLMFFLAMSLFVFTSCGDDEGTDPDPDDFGAAVTPDMDYFVGTWDIEGTDHTVTFNANGGGSTTSGSHFEYTENSVNYQTFIWNFSQTGTLNLTYAASIPFVSVYDIDESLERKIDLDQLGIDVVLTKEE